MMMTLLGNMVLLVCLSVTFCQMDNSVVVEGDTDNMFTFFLTPHYFNWTSRDTVRYRASLVGKPGLPSWVKYRHSARHRSGLLYGRPVAEGTTDLQVVATNRETFSTAVLTIKIKVIKKFSPSRNQVQMKIDNLNIEDIFDLHRRERLENLFKSRFWLESYVDLHLTYADSVLELGGRRPLKPSHKDGVILHLGSQANFSKSLIALDRETRPLRRHNSCSYKRISVERYFRQAGFSIDWCKFRLLTEEISEKSDQDVTDVPVGVDHSEHFHLFPVRSEMKRKQVKLVEIISALLVPIVVFIIYSVGLGAVLLTDCTEEKESKTNNLFIQSLFDVFDDCTTFNSTKHNQLIKVQKHIDNNNSINLTTNRGQGQVTDSGPTITGSFGGLDSCKDLNTRSRRASSVQRQNDTLRSLGKARDVTPRLLSQSPPTSMSNSSIHSRSRTTSPGPDRSCGSPDMRHSVNWEMLQSMNRPHPPPYGQTRGSRHSLAGYTRNSIVKETLKKEEISEKKLAGKEEEI